MRPIVILIVTFLLISQIFCQSIDSQLLCFKNQQIELRKTNLYVEIHSQFLDSLNLWLSKDLYGVRLLKKESYNIDENIYLNSTKDKCVLALLVIDTLTKHPYYSIEMVFGQHIDNHKWQFIISSMPTITYRIDELLDEKEGSFESMSIFLQQKLMKGGYYKKQECKINDDWVNGWLDKYRIKYHQEFLEGKR